MNFAVTFESGRWLVDGKRLEDLNMDERNALNDFFSEMKNVWEDGKDAA